MPAPSILADTQVPTQPLPPMNSHRFWRIGVNEIQGPSDSESAATISSKNATLENLRSIL